MAEETTTWYIEPLDAQTDKLIGQQDGLGLSDHHFHYQRDCADGRSRDLIELPKGWRDLDKLLKNMGQLNLKFRVFRQVNNRGIVPADDFIKKTQTKKKKVKAPNKANPSTTAIER